MTYQVRKCPIFSACGLNCGLCPRYYTDGASKCPGCAGCGFSEVHPACGVLSCCQRKGLEHCFSCESYPCSRYDGADLYDSFITHKNQFSDMNRAKTMGVEAYETELKRKAGALEILLKNYDDGRRKSFFCTAVNLLVWEDVNTVMRQIDGVIEPGMPIKMKAAAVARMFEDMAEIRGVSLRLRKRG